MISFTLTIEELKSGLLTINQDFRTKDQTASEIQMAKCLDHAIKGALRFIMDQTKDGKIIEGFDIETEAKLLMSEAFKSRGIKQGLVSL